MSLLNAAAFGVLMWDGRAATLEEQALLPFAARDEFDLPVTQVVVKLVQQGYSPAFIKAFGHDVDAKSIALSLAAYERTLIAGDSPLDRYLFSHQDTAISAAAKRGFDVFLRVKCDQCHLIMTKGLHPFALNWVMFTDGKFHNLGVGESESNADPGRYAVTGQASDWGAFRTPSLRNVELTAPYFHDGSAETLRDVVDFYDQGGRPNKNLDSAMHDLGLSSTEKDDLVAFLCSLTSPAARHAYNTE